MKSNSWELYTYYLFQERLDELEKIVIKLKEKNPDTYLEHPKQNC